jgi:hypothetical protein
MKKYGPCGPTSRGLLRQETLVLLLLPLRYAPRHLAALSILFTRLRLKQTRLRLTQLNKPRLSLAALTLFALLLLFPALVARVLSLLCSLWAAILVGSFVVPCLLKGLFSFSLSLVMPPLCSLTQLSLGTLMLVTQGALLVLFLLIVLGVTLL